MSRSPSSLQFCGLASALLLAACSDVTEPQTPVVLQTETLPRAVVGEPFEAVLKSKGGDGEHAYRVQDGSLPPGLSLLADGAIAGVPLEEGVFDFTVEVVSTGTAAVVARLALVVYPTVRDALCTSAVLLRAVGGSPSPGVFTVGGMSLRRHRVAEPDTLAHLPVILRYDQGAWSYMELPDGLSDVTLQAVWGAAPTEVFAVGSGYVLHWDGTSWRIERETGDINLRAVWGTSPDDLYVAGSLGMVIHYDGTAWSSWDVAGGPLLSGWAGASGEAYAVGYDGLFHYDSGSWSRIDLGLDVFMFDVWGTSEENIYAVGWGHVLRQDGAEWAIMHRDTLKSHIRAVWASSEDDVFIGSYTPPGSGLYRYDGMAWSEMGLPEDVGIWDLWGRSASEVYAIAGAGLLLRYDGNEWRVPISGSCESRDLPTDEQ